MGVGVKNTTSGDPWCILLDKADTYVGIIYSKTWGTQSIDPNSPLVNVPLELDTSMWIASCTKLMTAIAVLQCVEKGLLDLDEDISNVLPEWKDPDILRGFDEATGEPILEKVKGTITLRKMLSHHSGMGYPLSDPQIQRFIAYRKAKGQFVESGYLVCTAALFPITA
jgi:CubicO group peptidase (beta-lactamase class C family)